MSDPQVCKRCAATGPTCCQLGDSRSEFCFPLSEAERGRIREFAPDTGGFAMEPNSKAFVDALCRLFPGEEAAVRALFPERKEHLRLAVDGQGRCRFLGPGGCVVPTENRPYYCRIYPLWLAGDRITVFQSPSCLACQQALNQQDLLDCLGMTRAQVRDLMGRLRLVWGLPPAKGLPPVQKGF